MALKVNICELTKSDVRSRLTFAPQWVKSMPVQAQRRWLLDTYPKQYTVGADVKGATGGHLRDRGIWTTEDIQTFQVCLKIRTGRDRANGVSINWETVVPFVLDQYMNV